MTTGDGTALHTLHNTALSAHWWLFVFVVVHTAGVSNRLFCANLFKVIQISLRLTPNDEFPIPPTCVWYCPWVTAYLSKPRLSLFPRSSYAARYLWDLINQPVVRFDVIGKMTPTSLPANPSTWPYQCLSPSLRVM